MQFSQRHDLAWPGFASTAGVALWLAVRCAGYYAPLHPWGFDKRGGILTVSPPDEAESLNPEPYTLKPQPQTLNPSPDEAESTDPLSSAAPEAESTDPLSSAAPLGIVRVCARHVPAFALFALVL